MVDHGQVKSHQLFQGSSSVLVPRCFYTFCVALSVIDILLVMLMLSRWSPTWEIVGHLAAAGVFFMIWVLRPFTFPRVALSCILDCFESILAY